MKKLAAIVVSLSVMFSSFMPAVFAAENEGGAETKVYYSRSYESKDISGGDMLLYAKTNSITQESEENNKFLRLAVTDAQNSKDCFLQYAVKDTADNIVFSFDIKSEKPNAVSGFNFMLRDKEKNDIYLLKGNSKDIECGSKKVFSFSNKWQHIDMAVDFKAKKAQIYLDGKIVVKDEKLNSDFGVLDFCRLYISGDATSIDIDNYQIYEAKEPMKVDFSEADTNVLPNVKDTEGEAGLAILYNRTYDEKDQNPADGISITAKTNEANFITENNNTFLKMTSKINDENLNDCFADIAISSAPRFLVLEASFSIDEPGITGNLFGLKDSANKQYAPVSIRDNGDVYYTPISKKVATLQKGKWTKISFVIDTSNNNTDLYVDGKFAEGGVVFASKNEFADPAVWRIYLSRNKNSYGKSLYVDNVKVYEGKTLREIKEGELPPKRSIIPVTSDSEINLINQIGENTVVLNISAQSIFHHGQKSILDTGAQIKNNRTLVPVRAVSEALGCDVDWVAETQTAVIDGNAKITIGKNQMTLADGSLYELDAPAEIIDDRTMLPLRALCEKVLSKEVEYNDRGLIIISDKAAELTDDNIEAINNFMLYERPDAQAVDAAFKKNAPSHPRIYTNAAGFEKIKNSYQTNEYMKNWIDAAIKKADTYVEKQTVPKYEIPDGKRLLSQSSVASDIFSYCGFAYIMTGDKKYADHSYKAMEAIAQFPDWNPSHYLDVGEMSYGVALCYDWMYDAWTPEQRKFIEQTLYKYSLSVTEKAYYNQNSYNWWVMVDHNWNPWVNGSITCAALAVYEAYPELCADLISKAVRAQEYMLKSFYPDGAWMEGISYWDGTARFIARMDDSLNTALGTDFNLTKAPAMDKMGTCALNACGPTGYTNPYHDTGNNSKNNSAVIFWVAKQYNQPDLARIRLKQMNDFSFSGSLYDILWFNTDTTPSKITLPLDSYYRDVELVSMRGSWDSKAAAYVSAHGGYTTVNHHHMDSGNYVIDMLGERFIDDLGSETYSVIEHGTGKRYDYYRIRTEGHNLYVINPSDDVGQLYNNVFSPVEKMQTSNRSAYAVMNLTDAYKNAVTSAKRGYKLGDDRRSITVRDEFNLKGESEVYWFAHTVAEVEILDENSAKLTINGKSVKAIVTSNTGAKLEVMDAVPLATSKNPTQNANKGYKKLMLHFKKSGDTYVQVKYVPYDGALANIAPEDKALDSWSVEEGELRTDPLADDILIDGKTINNFDKNNLSYTERLNWDAAVPTVSAAAGEDCNVEVVQGSFDAPAKVTVTYKNDPSFSTTYAINFKVIADLSNLDATTKRLNVVNIKASDVPQPENADINICDADLGTRWSAQGEGQWIYVDMGKEEDVDGVCVAVMNGTTRTSYFAIDISSDGENWTRVLEETNSKGSDELEKYWFASRVKARYVRYFGFGNSVNLWNSVTEFGAIQKK